MKFYRIVQSHRSICYCGYAANWARRYNTNVMVPQDLLDMLVCPVCKTPVALVNNDTSLKCGQCCRVYPIQDDIPIMLVDSAKIEK
ncbi:MAG: Trm112 family protein [Terriglobales bacterium]